MSGAVHNRAAVFTDHTQAVEVWSAGEWLPGSLLGWRHDDTGGCQVWVRVSIGGREESRWTGLESLRLPEPQLPVPPPAPREDAAATRSLRLVDATGTGPARRGRPALVPVPRPAALPEHTGARGLPAVRDEVASRASHPAGRRRADSRTLGGTAELPSIGSSGRHRAPAVPGAGRHRAADTGVWPAVADAKPPRADQPADHDSRPGRAPQRGPLTHPMSPDGVGPVGPATPRWPIR